MPRWLRRLWCNLRPGWHRGWVSVRVVDPPNVQPLATTRVPLRLRPVGGRTVHWTRPRCVDCGTLEWD